MIIFENIISENQIQSLIGKPLVFSFRSIKTLGSGGFYLHKFKSPNNVIIEEGAKCNIQLYEKGFCIKCNYSNKLTFIPISFKEIKSEILTRFEETVHPYYLSIFWILLKLGVPLRISRHFANKRREYKIDFMHVVFKTDAFDIDLKASGFMFGSQLKFIKTLELSDVLEVIIKPPVFKQDSFSFFIISSLIAILMLSIMFFLFKWV